MSQSNNILSFPKIGIPRPSNGEELGQYFDNNKKEYIDHITRHYATQLLNKLAMHGFDVQTETFINNFSFTIETLRSALYRSLDLNHPFQDSIDTMIDALENNHDLLISENDDDL